MITVTRLNDSTMVINADLIESIETTPDTVVSMTTGKKILVRESMDEIVERVTEFKRKCGIRIINPDAVQNADRSL